MKKFILLAAASALILGSAAAQAQSKASATANPKSRSNSQAAIIIEGGALATGNPAVGAAASAAANSGLLGNPQAILSTGSAPSTGTFNDCGVAFSGGLWLLTVSYTGESKSCVAQRQALLAMSMGMPGMAFERMCDVEEWRGAAERATMTGNAVPECRATTVARDEYNRKNQPKVQTVATPAPVAAPQRAGYIGPNGFVPYPDGYRPN